MVRKITFIMAAFCLILANNAFADGVKKVGTINSYSYEDGNAKPDVPTGVTRQFYDADGNLVMDLSAYSKNTYSYNEAGLKDTVINYYWSSDVKQWVFSSKIAYEYDAEGNMTRMNSLNDANAVTSYTAYENYVNGYYMDRKSMSADGSTVYYWEHFNYTFDGDVLVSQINSYKPTETDSVILSKVEYTYTDGVLTSEESFVYEDGTYVAEAQNTYKTTYAYNTDGDLESEHEVSISRWGNYAADAEYIYGTYSADYAPTAFTAEVVTGDVAPNTITLSWTAATSSDVSGYMVICDTLIDVVTTETTFTTTTPVQNGTHYYAVVAVIDGKPSTISSEVVLEVNDEDVLPAENFKVTAIGTADELDGSYPVSVAWTAPTTTSTIVAYRVYYSDWSYVETTASATDTTVNISSWSAVATNEDGDEYGLEVTLKVVAVYATGIADASNAVTCIPYDGIVLAVGDIAAVSNVTAYPNPATDVIRFSENVSVKVYNLAGQRVFTTAAMVNEIAVSNFNKGLYLVETTDAKGAVAVSKVMVK